MFSKSLYYLTVHLPLRIIEIGINFLSLFKEREYIIKVVHRLFKEKVLMGVLPDGNLLVYPLDDRKILSIISEIYHKKIYDVRQIKNFKFVFDVGAHIGLFTLRMSKQASNSKIMAIEPNPTNYKLLVKNVSINGLADRVHTLNVAIGEKKEKALLLLNAISRGDGSMKRWHNAGAAGALMVHVVPLDEVLKIERSCDLMKIDVEGMESEVLSGLEKQYMKVNKLVIEIHMSVVNVTRIYEWLRTHGFEITKTQKLYDDCLVLEAQRLCE